MSWNEYKALIDKMDFMQRATNVYRTKYVKLFGIVQRLFKR